MKNIQIKISVLFLILLLGSKVSFSQICEWKLNNVIYTPTDPDGAGPALGTVTFTLQLHTTGGNIPDMTASSTGWSYQSAKAMIPTTPTGPGCPSTVSAPANVSIGGYYLAGGYAYTVVNQCGTFSQTVGLQMYDRRAVGTLDAVSGAGVTVDPTWRDVMTITMWTLSNTYPQGGYVMINSGAGGSPNPFPTYAVSDVLANEYVANSLTATTPLPLGTNVAPVTFAKFEASCNDKGTSLQWITSQEINSDYYELEKSFDGVNWKSIAKIKSAGNSSTDKVYNYLDLLTSTAKYRIKQVDVDGKFAYSIIASSNCTPKNIDITIYPVPAVNKLTVAIASNKNVNTQFIIYDATGRMVKQFTEKIVAGNNAINIDVTNLPSGQYIIRSTDEVLNLNKKFTILK